jgi:hypothetical protein
MRIHPTGFASLRSARLRVMRVPFDDILIDAERLIIDFVCVASLAGVGIGQKEIKIEGLSAPHNPPSKLPEEMMAVYVFYWGNQCLKVGKAGPKSKARYTSQHYGLNAPSTLAKSLLKHNGKNKRTDTFLNNFFN